MKEKILLCINDFIFPCLFECDANNLNVLLRTCLSKTRSGEHGFQSDVPNSLTHIAKHSRSQWGRVKPGETSSSDITKLSNLKLDKDTTQCSPT